MLQVEAIEAKYGVKLAQQAVEDVKLIYGTFVEALIPPGKASNLTNDPAGLTGRVGVEGGSV